MLSNASSFWTRNYVPLKKNKMHKFCDLETGKPVKTEYWHLLFNWRGPRWYSG